LTISQDELKDQLTAAASADSPFAEHRFEGRGIVICAGGARLFTCAWVAIGLLRRQLACTLPIEVWYLGPEEMGPPMRGLLEQLGAQPIDALEVAKRHQVERLGGWELKPYAVMHSRFREVLLLDADNVPVRDPSFLFEGLCR
jgi:Mannosyltransferase putative